MIVILLHDDENNDDQEKTYFLYSPVLHHLYCMKTNSSSCEIIIMMLGLLIKRSISPRYKGLDKKLRCIVEGGVMLGKGGFGIIMRGCGRIRRL